MTNHPNPNENPMTEQEFDVLLKSDDFKKSETLGDLFAIVAARKK